MKKNSGFGIILALLLSCAGSASAQGVPNFGGMGVPSPTPFVGFSLLAKSGAASALTGSTSETTLATITIPPNTLGPNGALKITAIWICTNSANSKSFRFRLGGLAGTIISSSVGTTISGAESSVLMINANATNSQQTFLEQARGTDGIVSTTINGSSAVDMTASQTLVITGQLALGTETMTLVGYTVEVAY